MNIMRTEFSQNKKLSPIADHQFMLQLKLF